LGWQWVGPHPGEIVEAFFCVEDANDSLVEPHARLVWTGEATSAEETKKVRDSLGYAFPTPEAQASMKKRHGGKT
jgi:hypothetical protein